MLVLSDSVPGRRLEGGSKSGLRTEFSGQPVTVEERIASGGQGELYVAAVGGRKCALKWYYPHTVAIDERLGERLRNARDKGPPGATSSNPLVLARSRRFLWPADLVVSNQYPGVFGYYMPLREERFVDFKKILAGKVRASFRAVVTAGMETAEAYNELHAPGLCYADISPGNVALDPESGEVRICDNDNVDVNNGKKLAVAGTPGYMAPEIVHDFFVKKEAHPNANTDRWSLAVLLFKLLVRDHPLEGEREDQPLPPSDYDLYGPDARFIWDETDESNRPVPGRHVNALRFLPALPRFTQKLFMETFTVGIRNPARRVYEAQWIKAMSRLRDSISPCPHCGAENFYDAEANAQTPCWSCGRQRTRPLILDLPGSKCAVAVGADAALFPHHVRAQSSFDFSNTVARMISVPRASDAIGLKNLSEETWHITFDNKKRAVPPKSVVVLHPGLHINFGPIEGMVS